jgi:hypothetical protein
MLPLHTPVLCLANISRSGRPVESILVAATNLHA